MNLELGPTSSRGSNYSDRHKNQPAFVRFLMLHALIPLQPSIKRKKVVGSGGQPLSMWIPLCSQIV